jgi:hypothetical protein
MTISQPVIGFAGKPRRAARLVAAVLVAGALTGVAASAASAAPSVPAAGATATPTCPGWVAVRPPDPGAQLNDLFGLDVLSAKNIWAVGDYAGVNQTFRTLIVHWNGKAWTRVPSPDPGSGSNDLSSVSAVSPSNIWAVGGYATQSGSFSPNRSLILHWNGHAWRQVASPSPGSFADELSSVKRVSGSNIWAVGTYTGSDIRDRSLILHWNGHAWSRVASPNPGKQSDTLSGLSAVSANSLWTTEVYSNGGGTSGGSQIVHWNGRTWSKAAAAPSGSDLVDVNVSSATNGWAVGDDVKGFSLALHWNGHTWKRVATPNLKPNQLTNALQSVTAVSPTSAWAVGYAEDLFNFDSTAIEMHWNGHAWSMMASPAPGGTSGLFGVQATSAASPWAVGEYGLSTQVQRTLAFRCR